MVCRRCEFLPVGESVIVGVDLVRQRPVDREFVGVREAVTVEVLVGVSLPITVGVPVARVVPRKVFLDVGQTVLVDVAIGAVFTVGTARVHTVLGFPVIRHAVTIGIIGVGTQTGLVPHLDVFVGHGPAQRQEVEVNGGPQVCGLARDGWRQVGVTLQAETRLVTVDRRVGITRVRIGLSGHGDRAVGRRIAGAMPGQVVDPRNVAIVRVDERVVLGTGPPGGCAVRQRATVQQVEPVRRDRTVVRIRQVVKAERIANARVRPNQPVDLGPRVAFLHGVADRRLGPGAIPDMDLVQPAFEMTAKLRRGLGEPRERPHKKRGLVDPAVRSVVTGTDNDRHAKDEADVDGNVGPRAEAAEPAVRGYF